MTARIFISYRTSDGADKATALARDLDQRFGDEQVFLDKDDLAAGSRWRDEIARALNQRPILLVLVTPQYLGAVDAAGGRRIDRADDPARAELAAALAADAHIVPLMCDGVDRTPDASQLPPPFDQLAELTWRRLRAYDWREDVARLAGDLERLGLVRRGAGRSGDAGAVMPAGELPGTGTGSGAGTTRVAGGSGAGGRRRVVLAGAALAAAAVGGAGWWAWQRREQRQQEQGQERQERQERNLAGRWAARIGARGATVAASGALVDFDVVHDGTRLRLTSEPVDIEGDRDWQNYRDFWKQRTGEPLKRVRYRGEGELIEEAATPRRISIAMRIEVPGVAEPIDGGNLHGEVGEAGRRINARMWINSEQGERVVVMRRQMPMPR